MHNNQLVATLTIPNTQTASNEISSVQFNGVRSLLIVSPGTLPETVTLQSADVDAATGTTFGAVQSPPGTDITVGAGKRVVLTEIPFPRFRLNAGVGVAADRVFQIWGRVGI